MVLALVLLSFAVMIALDHFVFSKRYPEYYARGSAKPALQPLPAPNQPIPAGIFLQSTYTWSRIGRSGEVYVGVHPMLLGLVGTPCEIEFRARGEHVAKGDPLVRIGRAGRRLTVRSPLAGKVDRVNRREIGEALWRGVAGHAGDWLYRLQPERVAEEVPLWFSGEEAAEWTRRRYDDLRAYLHGAVAEGHLGVMLADGGELPVGILAEMDERVWIGLEDRFLAPAGTTRTGSGVRPRSEDRP
jgi:glycine cleavage system H lipoate-binding protein